MDAKEFLEYQYGIILTEEKALIHPSMLIKALEEYAAYKIKNPLQTKRPNQKFSIGDNVKILSTENQLPTKITKIEWDGLNYVWQYYYLDGDAEWFENEEVIEKI